MKFYFFLFFEGDEAIVRTPFLKYGIIWSGDNQTLESSR